MTLLAPDSETRCANTSSKVSEGRQGMPKDGQIVSQGQVSVPTVFSELAGGGIEGWSIGTKEACSYMASVSTLASDATMRCLAGRRRWIVRGASHCSVFPQSQLL
jgi:hypothetical protein